MSSNIPQVDKLTVENYFAFFVNRLAHTLQSSKPHAATGRFYYYRPRCNSALTPETVTAHLRGAMTLGLYAINPATQRCKWVAIDADYENAVEDLLKLQWELRQDGVEAALEKSRRGGHLWIFTEQPLLARDCRRYIHSLAQRLKVPIKGLHSTQHAGVRDGIEIFPKQDGIRTNEFGNAIRGPLGVHRATGKRYWFYGADYTIEAQMSYLMRLRRITEIEMSQFVAGLAESEEVSSPARAHSDRRQGPGSGRREFSILEHLSGSRRRSGRNYFTCCPSCALQGRDKSGDNLAISVTDPRKYKCWAGCSKEDIRAALGFPIKTKLADGRTAPPSLGR